MFRLLAYLKPHWKMVVLAPLFMLIEVFTDLMQPLLMASIIDVGIQNGDLAHIQKTGLIMLGIAFLGLIGGIGCTIFATMASQYFGADVRKSLFSKVQTFSFYNLDQYKTGSLITRLTNDVQQMSTFVQMLLRVLTRAPLLALGSMLMAFLISPSLSIIFFVVIPILGLLLFYVMRKALPLFSIVQNKLDGVNTVLQENLAGIRVVKAFVRAVYEKLRFGKANEDYRDRAIKAVRLVAVIMPIMMLLLNGSIVAVLWFGGVQFTNNNISIGELVAFITYVTQVLFSLMLVSMMLMFVSRAKASADRMNEVFDTNPDITSIENAKQVKLQQGRIVFDQVSFAYTTSTKTQEPEWVLRNLSFTAEPGKTVAVLGATGSGKSTMMHLIGRLYEASSGRILIDDIDIKEMDLHSLRSHIGFVLQKALLFSGTIKENIGYGSSEYTDEQVEAAAKAAQAHEFIIKMPDGYDTTLGHRGINLSGGQKQRISIARALLVRPKILILDDSTSAVDLATEYHIQQALKVHQAERTTLVIAQRISSVLNADHILVMDQGRIVSEGTHEQLMQDSRVYQEIYQSQLGKEEIVHEG